MKKAYQELNRDSRIRIVGTSSFYESEPVGYLDQAWFLNQVMEIATILLPRELLHILQVIENELGRKRLIRWGPRVIDLDLLLYEDVILTTDELIIPHPRMYERNFVLIPLNEIAPNLRHPDGKTTAEHLQEYLKTAPEEKIRLIPGGKP